MGSPLILTSISSPLSRPRPSGREFFGFWPLSPSPARDILVGKEGDSLIYFDRKTLKILSYIRRRGKKGATWDKLQQKFGNDAANPYLLESLSSELYTVTKDQTGKWISFDRDWDHVIHGSFRSYCTPKGKELLERRSFDFWKFIIPTVISVVALVVSFIAAVL